MCTPAETCLFNWPGVKPFKYTVKAENHYQGRLLWFFKDGKALNLLIGRGEE